jgi:hypothetical protein
MSNDNRSQNLIWFKKLKVIGYFQLNGFNSLIKGNKNHRGLIIGLL